MRKRWLITGALLVIGAVALCVSFPREPFIEGKPLSEWIQISQSGRPLDRDAAHAVIHNLGTNEVPVLLKWLQEKPDEHAGISVRLNEAYARLRFWLTRHHLLKARSVGPLIKNQLDLDHFSLALQVLPELGRDARNFAIPTLVQRLGDRRDWVMSGAWLTLPKMVPESIVPLTQCLSDPDFQVRVLAADALGDIGEPAKSAVPALKLALADTNDEVRVAAAGSLGKLGCDPQIFLPAVIQSLALANSDLLDYQLEILTHYTNEAKAAVPLLLTILDRTAQSTNTTNVAIHTEVVAALRFIDPQAPAAIARSPSK